VSHAGRSLATGCDPGNSAGSSEIRSVSQGGAILDAFAKLDAVERMARLLGDA
jgi:hypothetical protein